MKQPLSNTSDAWGMSQWKMALAAKWKDYLILVKVRLNLTVVFSATIGYLLAAGAESQFSMVILLGLAGFLITSSANAINQIIEKDFDKLMKRTFNRPLAAGRMTVTEAALVAGICGVTGIGLLAYCFNELAAILGALSLLSYAFIYTPLKRISPIAILVGAIPGALPPMIGWVAFSGGMDYEAIVLFSMQFLWQFPHFWAIGWLGAEEYEKAGFKLMPTPTTKNKSIAVQAMLYIAILIIVSIMPYWLGMLGIVSLVAAVVLGLMFFYFGLNLFFKCDNKAALQLMFASIIYLPLMQIIMVLDSFFLM